MSSTSETGRNSRGRIWTGTILSGIAVLFLLFDSVGKLLKVAPVVTYTIPRTAILGAVLLTGYMGGAIATHVRVGNPLLTHTLFPIYVAVLFWGGLFLRDERLRVVLRRS